MVPRQFELTRMDQIDWVRVNLSRKLVVYQMVWYYMTCLCSPKPA